MGEGTITWVHGPVLHARSDQAFQIHEAVAVGNKGLLGEVIHLDGHKLVVQVYEDTTGLRPGDPVRGHGQPLSIPVGPGLLGNIFDGLLRPLDRDVQYVQPGLFRAPAARFPFTPDVDEGERLTPGQTFGRLQPENGKAQACLVPPEVHGRVVSIREAGEYGDDETLCTLETPDGETRELGMQHPWPVRTPRPVRSRLPVSGPLVTGQRILDTLFPVARGGKAALPGGFGTGKTVLQESLAKFCDADVIVYVGCGERGNEMAGVLHEFPALEDPRTGRPLMERTVIIANTSNMPVAAREASIYTGITVAEYFRDQGLHVALMADSTSRWAEALREISGSLGELPGEGGYPAYLSSRLAGFYERAARVETLGEEEGSLTIVGAVSPPGGDFSEPVTIHTKRYVRCFWGLDRSLAQSRFYPAVHPLSSYSEDAEDVEPWWQSRGNPQWAEHRRRFLTLLEEQVRLERMARIVGKDALPPGQQLTLLCADLVREGFLRQSSFSPADRYCSPERQTAMMRLIVRFIELAEEALANGAGVERIQDLPILRRLQRMGEEVGEEQMATFRQLGNQLESAFAPLVGDGTGEEDEDAG